MAVLMDASKNTFVSGPFQYIPAVVSLAIPRLFVLVLSVITGHFC